jgi:hypothetical protein
MGASFIEEGELTALQVASAIVACATLLGDRYMRTGMLCTN